MTYEIRSCDLYWLKRLAADFELFGVWPIIPKVKETNKLKILSNNEHLIEEFMCALLSV